MGHSSAMLRRAGAARDSTAGLSTVRVTRGTGRSGTQGGSWGTDSGSRSNVKVPQPPSSVRVGEQLRYLPHR